MFANDEMFVEPLEGESEGWEQLGVGLMGVWLPWKVRVRVGNYWGWGSPGRIE